MQDSNFFDKNCVQPKRQLDIGLSLVLHRETGLCECNSYAFCDLDFAERGNCWEEGSGRRFSRPQNPDEVSPAPRKDGGSQNARVEGRSLNPEAVSRLYQTENVSKT